MEGKSIVVLSIKLLPGRISRFAGNYYQISKELSGNNFSSDQHNQPQT